MKKQIVNFIFLISSAFSISSSFAQVATDDDALHPTIAQTTDIQGSNNRYLFDDEGPRSITPRLADGTVDLGGDGVWSLPWVSNFANARDVPQLAPWKPWVKAMWEYHKKTDSRYDPEGFCLPPGGPRAMATPYPAEIVQNRDRIFVIFEGGGHVWREIHMDGREHPDDVNPTYFGHSVGRWDGDTLIIDTVGFNEKSWLDYSGHHHTDQLHTVEYITRPYKEKMHYRVLIDDPGAFNEPWMAEWDIRWSEGQELQDYICQENNRFLLDLTDDLGQPFFETTPGINR